MNFRRIINAVFRKWWLIVLISIIGGLAGFFMVYFSPSMYKGEVTLYSLDLTRIQEEGEDLEYYDIQLSREVLQQFRNVIYSRRVTSVVEDQLSEYALSEGDLLSMTTIDSSVDDNIFYITAESTDPVIASRVANAMSAQFAVIIHELLNTDNVGILDQAIIPDEPEAKNTIAVAILGAFAGFVFGFTAVYLKEYFDPRVYDKQDLYAKFGDDILGSVPKYIAVEGEGK